MKLAYILALSVLVLISVCISGADYFKDFESELIRTKAAISGDDFSYGKDNRKEIEIMCPGSERPVVSIRDLISDGLEALSGDEGECLSLKMTGSNFSFKLSINCDSNVKMERSEEL